MTRSWWGFKIWVCTALALALSVSLQSPTAAARRSCNPRAHPHANLAGCNLSRRNLRGVNLSHDDLAHADLARADLFRANLTGANLTGAKAFRANFTSAKLSFAEVMGANFTHSNFQHAVMRHVIDWPRGRRPAARRRQKLRRRPGWVNLRHANLAHSNLAGSSLANAAVQGSTLTGANLTQVNWAGSDLAGLDLAGAILSEVDLAGVTLSGSNLTGTNLAGVNLTGSVDKHTNFTGANLAGASLADATITESVLTGANLGGVDFSGTLSGGLLGRPSNFAHSYILRGGYVLGPKVDLAGQHLANADLSQLQLVGADLAGADLVGADLTGSNLDKTDLAGADLTGATVLGASDAGADVAGALPYIVAAPHTYDIAQGSDLPVPAAVGLLHGASGLGLRVSGAGAPPHGTVHTYSDGAFSYVPAQGYTGDDSFTYTLTDFFGRTATATADVVSTQTGSVTASYDYSQCGNPEPGLQQVLSDGTNLWLGCNGSEMVVDPADGSVLATYPSHGTLMGYMDGYMWSAQSGTNAGHTNGTITAQDVSSGAVAATFTVPSFDPVAMGYYDSHLWLLNLLDPSNPKGYGDLEEIDPSTGSVLAVYSSDGMSPVGMAFDGSDIWILNRTAASKYDGGVVRMPAALGGRSAPYVGPPGSLVEIAPASGAVVSSIASHDSPSGFSLDSGAVWVSWGPDEAGYSGLTEYSSSGSTLSSYSEQGTFGMQFDQNLPGQSVISEGGGVWASSSSLALDTPGLVEVDPSNPGVVGVYPGVPYQSADSWSVGSSLYAEGAFWLVYGDELVEFHP